jgi:hypothetical protein
MSLHRFSLLSLALMGLLLASCYQSPPFVYVGGEPEPNVPGEDHVCVDYDDSNNPELSLYDAIHSRSDASLFAEWIDWLIENDIEVNEDLKGTSNNLRTVLVPDNAAMRAFANEIDLNAITETQFHTLVKHHMLMTAFNLNQFEVSGIAAGMNREPVEFEVENGHCVTFEERGRILISDDLCFNGVIHIIDQVLIPDRGF